MNAFSKTVCMVAVLAAALPLTAKANGEGRINRVALSPATVCVGDEVIVTVVVYPGDRVWSSTSIDGVCFNHSNHSGSGTFQEVFVIIAPSLQGVGNVQVKAFTDDDCESQLGRARNARLTAIMCDGEDGLNCWDLNGNFECDDDEDINDDDVCDALDCRGEDGQNGQDGQDGQDCTVTEVKEDYIVVGAEICCGDDCVTVYNGEDGEQGEQGPQGVPGTSCTVEQDGPCATIKCEDYTSATVCNGDDGINCWDLNENGEGDFCHPDLQDIFDGCPDAEDFRLYFECESPTIHTTAALQAAETFTYSECSAVVSCEEFFTACGDGNDREYPCLDPEDAAEICSFTEDANDDGSIDVIDCQGEDGSNGSNGGGGSNGADGADGTDGADGQDGADGVSCVVVDNSDGTCTIQCEDSSVTIFNCGDGAAPPADPAADPPADPPADDVPPMCGSFGGGFILLFIPLLWVKSRSWRRRQAS